MNALSSVPGQRLPVYANGKVVGYIVFPPHVPPRIEKRGLCARRHQLQRPPAWAMDRHHLALLRSYSGAEVWLYQVTGEVAMASLADFDAHGFSVQRGYGDQVALELKYWREPDGPVPVTVPTTPKLRDGLQKQMELAS